MTILIVCLGTCIHGPYTIGFFLPKLGFLDQNLKNFGPTVLDQNKFWSENFGRFFEKSKNFGQSSFGPIFKILKILVKAILVKEFGQNNICLFLRNQNIWLYG